MSWVSFMEDILERAESDMHLLHAEIHLPPKPSKQRVVEQDAIPLGATGLKDSAFNGTLPRCSSLLMRCETILEQTRAVLAQITASEVPLALQVAIHQKTEGRLKAEVENLRQRLRHMDSRLNRANAELSALKRRSARRARGLGGTSR
jgi:hypothetical protein